MPNHNTRQELHELKNPAARPGVDYAHLNLKGWNFRGADLQGANLSFTNLQDADLRGCDLFGAQLLGTNLRGCRLEMTRLVEIWIPKELPLSISNQIRAYDFGQVMTRFVGPNRDSEYLSCPYQDAKIRPLLYEWGSRTWNHGAQWSHPETLWTLEEIIAAVLDHLGCHHDLRRAFMKHPQSAPIVSW